MKEYVLEENITLKNAYEIKEQLLELLHTDSGGLAIDFKNVKIIDSTGLGILVSILKKTQQNNQKLQLVNIHQNVKDIFALTMLDTIFEII